MAEYHKIVEYADGTFEVQASYSSKYSGYCPVTDRFNSLDEARAYVRSHTVVKEHTV